MGGRAVRVDHVTSSLLLQLDIVHVREEPRLETENQVRSRLCVRESRGETRLKKVPEEDRSERGVK